MKKIIPFISSLLPTVLILAIVVFLIRYVMRYFETNPLRKIVEENKEQIAASANDMMSNGYTYYNASQYIFEALYASNPLGWWKSTDKEKLGNFMLSVRAAEYKQLYNTYFSYKQAVGTWIIGSQKDDLTTDLTDCFSKSQQTLYLKHLPL